MNGAWRRRRVRAWVERATTPGGLFVSAVMAVALLPVTGVIRDPDFWWHLRAGQLMVTSKALIATDPFTYTATGNHWTMHEWLTEVAFALLHQVGGLGLIVVVLSLVTWLGLLCVLLRSRLRRPGMLVLGLGMLLGTVAGYPIWGPRAQMITFALSCLLLLLIDRHLERGGRMVWLLVPLFLLWSNLHSGFIIGLGFLAVVIAAECVGALLRSPGGAPMARVRTLGLVLVACAVVAMVNPNGPGILLYAFQTQGSAAQQSLIAEWHSPDFHEAQVLPFAVMLLSLAAMIAINRRIRARDAALALVCTALALQSVRHVALFVAAVTPVWIGQADQLLQRRHRPKVRPARPLPPLGMRALTYAAAIGLIAIFYAGSRLLPALRTTESSATYTSDFPVCAARWLAAAPEPLRIFNQYGEGGYLAYVLSARGDRVFIFGDAALMGDPLLYRYSDVETLQPDWDSVIRSSGTDLVLFDANTPLADVLAHDPGWLQVYRDAHSVAFVPAGDRPALPAAARFFAPGDPCAPQTATVAAARAVTR